MPLLSHRNLLTACRVSLLIAALAVLGGCVTTEPDKSASESNPFQGLSVEEILQSGDDALRAEEYERAMFIYMQAVEVEESADVWYRIGLAKVRLDDRTFAWRAFTRSIDMDPKYAASHEELGLLYIGMGQPEAAGAELTEAIRLDPTRWRANNALGVMADMNKQYANAVAFYMAALEINVKSGMLMNNIGYSYYLAGDLQNATNWFDAAIQAEPDYEPAIKNLALLYARQGWYPESVNTFKKVVDDPQALNDVGYIAMRNGDYVEASTLLAEAIRLSPVYYETAYENLERVREALDRLDRRQQNEQLADNMSEVVFPDDHEKKSRTVMPQALNIRSAPSPDAEIVNYLKTGDEVQIILSQPGWAFISYQVRAGGEELTGWVNTRYLLDEDQAPEQSISNEMIGSQAASDAGNIEPMNSPVLPPAAVDPGGVTLPTIDDSSLDKVAEMPIDLSALRTD